MITTEQAKEYLESVGITLPDFILQAIVEQANSIQECLDAHYPPATALLIQSYLLGLMALGQGDRYISFRPRLTAHRVHFGISLLLTDGRGPCHCCVALTNSGVPMDSSPQTRPIQRLLVSGLVKVVACVMGISNGMDIG